MEEQFDRAALFADYSAEYIVPWQPRPYSRVRLFLRTGRHGIRNCFLLREGEDALPMLLTGVRGEFAYYAGVVELDTDPLRYAFAVDAEEDGEELRVLYTRNGIKDWIEAADFWQLIPGFETPKWMWGAVTYQIYVDRFANGDPDNDVLDGEYRYLNAPVRRITDWNALPEPMDVGNFYGGDLRGVLDRMDYLEALGVQVLYFNPLFVSPSNHKYDSQDYEHIDPHLGCIVRDGGRTLPASEEDNARAERYIQRTTDPANLMASDQLFIKLVEEAHARGMRVIVDGVFNHCGSFHHWMDREGIYRDANRPRGAYPSADSPYRDYFFFRSDHWPDNGDYEGWWGHETLPKLAYEQSAALQQEILDIGVKWVSAPFNADGWRLDVAADLGRSPEENHRFWQRFRRAVKQANPQAVILAEHYGAADAWLQGDQWDTVMNYDHFMEPVSFFLTGMEKHSDDYRPELHRNGDDFFRRMLAKENTGTSAPPRYIAMNQLSNHDHSRFLTRTNSRVGRVADLGSEAASEGIRPEIFRQAVIIQMTWTGAPTLYYGDEAGVCGFTDPDSRRTYPWGREDSSLLDFHRAAIRMHRKLRALTEGALIPLTWENGIISYGRFLRKESIVVAVNANEEASEVTIPVRLAEAGREMEIILSSDMEGWQCGGEKTEARYFPVTDGEITLTLGPREALVLREKH